MLIYSVSLCSFIYPSIYKKIDSLCFSLFLFLQNVYQSCRFLGQLGSARNSSIRFDLYKWHFIARIDQIWFASKAALGFPLGQQHCLLSISPQHLCLAYICHLCLYSLPNTGGRTHLSIMVLRGIPIHKHKDGSHLCYNSIWLYCHGECPIHFFLSRLSMHSLTEWMDTTQVRVI